MTAVICRDGALRFAIVVLRYPGAVTLLIVIVGGRCCQAAIAVVVAVVG